MPPDTAATVYYSHFLALAPKYFNTETWLTNTAITPAMKNAGNRHSTTCSRAYHWARSSVAFIAVVNRVFCNGMKNTAVKIATIQNRIFNSFFVSIFLLYAKGFLHFRFGRYITLYFYNTVNHYRRCTHDVVTHHFNNVIHFGKLRVKTVLTYNLFHCRKQACKRP